MSYPLDNGYGLHQNLSALWINLESSMHLSVKYIVLLLLIMHVSNDHKCPLRSNDTVDHRGLFETYCKSLPVFVLLKNSISTAAWNRMTAELKLLRFLDIVLNFNWGRCFRAPCWNPFVVLSVPSTLTHPRSSMSHFDGTCMMEHELVHEISRVAKWVHPKQPARKWAIIMDKECDYLLSGSRLFLMISFIVWNDMFVYALTINSFAGSEKPRVYN